MSMSQELAKKYNKNLLNNIQLSNYSWFNLGGPAEYFFKPENEEQLIEFIKENKKYNLPITILGAGSNTLIRDKGIKGVVIKLGPNFSKIKLIDDRTIEVGAATLDKKVSGFAKDNSISGFEFLSCIPGSVGGAVIMNSGCYGEDISKILISIDVVDLKSGQKKTFKNGDIKFHYRGTDLPDNFLITSILLRGECKSKDLIEKIQNEMIIKKKRSQPSQIKTCGSTFKNVNFETKAWKLIKETGCNKFKEGDAAISEKHCNFFVNNGNARAADIEKLIHKVKKAVNDKTGVDLELEIKIIGD